MPQQIPDYDHATMQTDIWRGEHKEWFIQPGGFMVAIVIQHIGELPSSDQDHRARFRLFPNRDVAPVRVIDWEYHLHSCGIVFSPPVVNVNTAHPYIIKREYPHPCPDLEINVLYALQKF